MHAPPPNAAAMSTPPPYLDDAQIERLRGANQAQREAMAGLDPRRADVILAGASILRAIVRRLAVTEIVVSDRGIRWGLLFERIEAAAAPSRRLR